MTPTPAYGYGGLQSAISTITISMEIAAEAG